METGRTPSTCGKAGTVTKTCTKCGHVETETLPTTAHSYTESIVQPTCTEAGYTTHTCSACGTSYTDTNVPALGHDWLTTQEQRVVGSEEHTFCNTCGLDFTATGIDGYAHIKEHALAGEGAGMHTNVVPIYETVTVTRCTRCGATQ